MMALMVFMMIGQHALVAEDTVIAKGVWFKRTQKISGTWHLYDKGTYRELHFIDFKTKKAPDLQVFLSPHFLSNTTNKNAMDGAKPLGKLKSPKGNQVYRIPADVDLKKFRSVLIHCKKYSKLWGAGNLRSKSTKK